MFVWRVVVCDSRVRSAVAEVIVERFSFDGSPCFGLSAWLNMATWGTVAMNGCS